MLHVVKKIMPEAAKDILRPSWYKVKQYTDFYKSGGWISRDQDIQEHVASRKFNGKPLPIVVRSAREFKRWTHFGNDNQELVHSWLTHLKDCGSFWDIGSANGLEGFYVSHVHDCHVLFLEPFTPSIETILKTAYIHQKSNPLKKNSFTIVQALIDEKTDIQKLDMHEKPVPGDTKNSAHHGLNDYVYGGRQGDPITLSQWLTSIALDDLYARDEIPSPDYVKIDVDGFEINALKGATKLLASGCVKEWCIEVNDNRVEEVETIMKKHGYEKTGESAHYPEMAEMSPRDCIFKKIN